MHICARENLELGGCHVSPVECFCDLASPNIALLQVPSYLDLHAMHVYSHSCATWLWTTRETPGLWSSGWTSTFKMTLGWRKASLHNLSEAAALNSCQLVPFSCWLPNEVQNFSSNHNSNGNGGGVGCPGQPSWSNPSKAIKSHPALTLYVFA